MPPSAQPSPQLHPAPLPDAAPCPNCGSALARRYCPERGQQAPGPDDYSIRAHIAELTDGIASRNGRALQTLATLAARPGVLTADHLAGRRARYLKPLQLFLLVNVLLFVAAPQVPLFSYSLEKYVRYAPPSPTLASSLVRRAVAERGMTREAYTQAFDARVDAQRKTLIILFVPALALLLRLLFARRRRPGVPWRYGEHLVFVLHALSFVWLTLAAVGVTGRFAGVLGSAARYVAVPVVLALLLGIPVYLLLALRRAYDLSLPVAIGVAAAVMAAFTLLLVAYRGFLFFATYYTL